MVSSALGCLIGAFLGFGSQQIYQFAVPFPQYSLWPIVDYYAALDLAYWSIFTACASIGFCHGLLRWLRLSREFSRTSPSKNCTAPSQKS